MGRVTSDCPTTPCVPPVIDIVTDATKLKSALEDMVQLCTVAADGSKCRLSGTGCGAYLPGEGGDAVNHNASVHCLIRLSLCS